jgi:hypothetical protein
MIFVDEGNFLKAHITMGQGNSKYIKECNDPEADMCGIIYQFNSKSKKLDYDLTFNKLNDVEIELQFLWGRW